MLASQKMKVADALLGRMQKKTGSGKVERSKLGGCWVRGRRDASRERISIPGTDLALLLQMLIQMTILSLSKKG